MAQGLGAFTEGLQGGIAARDRMDLNRQYKERLAQANALGREEIAGMDQTRGALAAGLGEDYTPIDYQQQKDPALMRFGGWLKGKIGGVFGSGSEEQGALEGTNYATPEIQPAGQQASGATTYGMPERYADGGSVEDEESELMKRQRAQAARSTEALNRAPETAGGFGPELMEDIGRNVMGNTRRRMSEWAPQGIESSRGIGEAEGAYETGEAVRGDIAEGARGVGQLALGLAEDTGIPQALGAVGRFGAGFIGMDGGGEEAAEAIPTGPAKAARKGGDKAAAISASVDAPETSDEQVAQTAITAGEEAAAENFDYRMLPENMRPEDMPSMSTTDWTEHRGAMIMGLVRQGKDPDEAFQIVDDITVGQQMKGMNRELIKAQNYLQMNDLRAAGFAIRQGFQYFPNGVDVSLAIQTGPNGQKALVAMGKDEQTGEPTGNPMIITSETLGVMRDNLSDPKAFTTWTKDGREAQMALREQERREFDTRSSASYREESAISGRMTAEASQIRALTGGTSGGGVKESDLRASDEAIAEMVFAEVDLDPAMMPAVEEATSLIRRGIPSQFARSDREIANLMIAAEAGGQLEDVISYLRQGGDPQRLFEGE